MTTKEKDRLIGLGYILAAAVVFYLNLYLFTA